MSKLPLKCLATLSPFMHCHFSYYMRVYQVFTVMCANQPI